MVVLVVQKLPQRDDQRIKFAALRDRKKSLISWVRDFKIYGGKTLSRRTITRKQNKNEKMSKICAKKPLLFLYNKECQG